MKEKDIKILWGRAAERCSFSDCKIKLSKDKLSSSESFPIGEQAHIVAEELNGPRGESPLSKEERNSYFNMILLCPTHHTEVDKNPDDYTVEKMHLFKSQHELWVEENLSKLHDTKSLANEIVYTDLIDSAVELLDLYNWETWSSNALSTSMNWNSDADDKIYLFRQKIIKAVWPNELFELEKSLQTISILANRAIQTFLQHSELDEVRKKHYAIRFYKIPEWNPKLYKKILSEYNIWEQKCFNLVIEISKALNWFADVVRRDIDPLFFAKQGKFTVMYGPNMDLSYITELYEYTEDEKNFYLIQLMIGLNNNKA